MTFKINDDTGRNAKISGKELEHEEIPVEVEYSDVELHNPDEVEEQA